MDDGAADLKTSLRMARIAVADGIKTVVATPHIIEGYYDGGDRAQRLADLGGSLATSGLDLELVNGAEVPMSTCLAGDEEMLRSLTIAGGRYLLMETADTTYDQIAQAAYRVRLCGLYPILAHPERTFLIQERPERLSEIVDREVFFQVTAASLEGVFGKSIKKTSLALAAGGMLHLVASDAHSAGRRAPRLSGSYKILRRELGDAAARTIMFENPARVLHGERMDKPPMAGARASRRWSLSGFLGRH